MISQVFGGMENLSFVGDTSRFKTEKKPLVHSSYQNLTMSNSVARNRTLKCKKAPSNVRKGPFNIKSKNTMVFNKMPKSKFKSNYKPPQRFCTYSLYLSEYFSKSYICLTTRPFLIRKKCVLKPV